MGVGLWKAIGWRLLWWAAQDLGQRAKAANSPATDHGAGYITDVGWVDLQQEIARVDLQSYADKADVVRRPLPLPVLKVRERGGVHRSACRLHKITDRLQRKPALAAHPAQGRAKYDVEGAAFSGVTSA